MNQTIRTLKNHKSIRKFKSIEPSDEVLRDIIECGIRSSSSGNMQGWSLIITKDKKQKEKDIRELVTILNRRRTINHFLKI